MLRLLAALALSGLLPAAAAAQTGRDTALETLSTLDAARGWEAVGRLDIDGKGFCTAVLISETQLLTAAHCLYDRDTLERIDPGRIRFRAGLRDGRAEATRMVRRAVSHPGYEHDGTADLANVRRDVAILELVQPIRSSRIVPFDIGDLPSGGGEVGIVSYALDRAEAPSLQEVCTHLGSQNGVVVLSCEVDHGSSGAPIFSMAGARPRIVSVVSAKAEMDRLPVALGMDLREPLATIEAEFEAGAGDVAGVPQSTIRVLRPGAGDGTGDGTGAKFLRP